MNKHFIIERNKIKFDVTYSKKEGVLIQPLEWGFIKYSACISIAQTIQSVANTYLFVKRKESDFINRCKKIRTI